MIAVGWLPVSRFGWSNARCCSGPGDVSAPSMTARTRSEMPMKFHTSADLPLPGRPFASMMAVGSASRPVITSPVPAGTANMPGVFPTHQLMRNTPPITR